MFDLNLTIEKGSFNSIIGQSGSGKSTLLNILGTLDRPTGGEIVINGVNTKSMNPNQLAKLRNETLGFIFQFHYLLPEFTALENVLLPTRIAGIAEKTVIEKAHSLFEDLNIAARLHHKPSELSGGEAQRVAVARALINSPKIIFADEPTGNLDSKSGLAVMSILQKLNDEGKTVILVTHEATTARHAKRMLSLLDGVLVGDTPITNRVFAARERELVK